MLREKKGLPPTEEPKPEKAKKEPDPRFERLKTIRTIPKRVVLKSVETGDEITFPSIYKAAQFIKQSPRRVNFGMEECGIRRMKLELMRHLGCLINSNFILLIYCRA